MIDLTASLRPSNVGVPRLAPSVIDRPRVVDAVVDHVEHSRIVWIVGVAGAGKTTVAAQVASQISMPVAWVTAEDWDRAPARFLDDLSHALTEVVPGIRGLIEDELREPRQLAAALGALLGERPTLLVVDDVHLLASRPASAALIGSLLARADGLRTLLVGRSRVAIAGAGGDALSRSIEIGDDLLAAEIDEAAEILAARGSDVDVHAAVRASAGWIAGMVLESAESSFGVASTGFEEFLRSGVRPRLSPEEDDFLVRSAVFDCVDLHRARALDGDQGSDRLLALRRAGLPGSWIGEGNLRMHPRIREILRAELEQGASARHREALAAAAQAFEGEGDLERALEAWLAAGSEEDARRVLPRVIGAVIGRLDLAQAEHLLARVPFDEEPAEVVHAQLALAFLGQEAERAQLVLKDLLDDERFARVVGVVPAVGALAVALHSEIGEVEKALLRYELLPRGRARDVARYYLSTERDDPEAPLPPFAGDILDGLVCSGLWYRGRLAELQRITTPALAAVSGVPELVDIATQHRAPLAEGLSRLAEAIATRDREAALSVLADLERLDSGSHIFLGLVEAEIAIRLERDAISAFRGIARCRALPEAANVSYAEWIATLEGAAHLLADDHRVARTTLLQAVGGMRRGDRLLHLPTALVYLAEAEWRCGDEAAADRATAEALSVARKHGAVSRLLLAFADFPAVLSRAIDLESQDGELHAMGRALVRDPRRARGGATPAVHVHLREFGEPVLLLDGVPARPKLRRSIEIISFLLARRRATADRQDVLVNLWNGRDDNASRAYLRQAVKHLREVLPAGVLRSEGDALSLAGAVSSESAELELLLDAAAADAGAGRRRLLLEAIAIGRRGPFLEGSEGVVWVDDRRRAFEAALLGARLDAGATLLDEGRLLEALTMADDVLETDPLLERGWRLRMQVQGLLGDGDGVLDSFRSCHQALAQAGLAPSRATVEIAQRMRG